jgi:hypothetical protein
MFYLCSFSNHGGRGTEATVLLFFFYAMMAMRRKMYNFAVGFSH